MSDDDENRLVEIYPEKCNEFEEFDVDNKQLIEKIVQNGQFERIRMNELTYDCFFREYLRPNIPVIVTGIAAKWECSNWIRQEGSENSGCMIDFEYLKEQIGADVRVPVANCHQEYFNSHEKLELGFHEFIDYWMRRVAEGTNDHPEKLLYLKDWHLRRLLPTYRYYQTPVYFGSDWLNEYCEDTGSDDYRFVYMGPKGTWTPFHVDVFSSFSWSTNIVGIKKWLFLIPNEELKLEDQFGNVPFSIDEAILDEKHVKYIEIIQNAGETVFVPSGWYHQVWNLADTISVNHNWFNACNVLKIYTEMKMTYGNVVDEIADCKDMEDFEGHCQLMLRSVFGMNFEMFFDLLDVVVKNRVRVAMSNERSSLVNDVFLGQTHAAFDLKMVSEVLRNIDEAFSDDYKWKFRCRNLFEQIHGANNLLENEIE